MCYFWRIEIYGFLLVDRDVWLLLEVRDVWILPEDRDVWFFTRGKRCMGYYLRKEMYGLLLEV